LLPSQRFEVLYRSPVVVVGDAAEAATVLCG